jgi:hypothetical protein
MRFGPPRTEFDSTPATDLAGYLAPAPIGPDELYPTPRRRTPFKDYSRMLTPAGGILL